MKKVSASVRNVFVVGGTASDSWTADQRSDQISAHDPENRSDGRPINVLRDERRNAHLEEYDWRTATRPAAPAENKRCPGMGCRT